MTVSPTARSEGPAFDGSEVQEDGVLLIHVDSARRALQVRDANKGEHVRLACEAAWGPSADPARCSVQRMAGFGDNCGVYLISRGSGAGTLRPHTFIVSIETLYRADKDSSVCEDSYRCQSRRNRILRSLPTLASVRTLTDSVLSSEEINARGLPVAGAGDRIVMKRSGDERELAGHGAAAAVGAAPGIIGCGDGWFAAAYGGETLPRATYLDELFCERHGRCAARLHRADASWFDTHRAAMLKTWLAMDGLPHDSMLWPAACYFPREFQDGCTQADFLRLHAAWPPYLSAAAGRLVHLHNDLWFTNVVQSSAGDLVAVDFEGACVGPAIRDLLEEEGDTAARRRVHCRSYLEEAGFPAGESLATLSISGCLASNPWAIPRLIARLRPTPGVLIFTFMSRPILILK